MEKAWKMPEGWNASLDALAGLLGRQRGENGETTCKMKVTVTVFTFLTLPSPCDYGRLVSICQWILVILVILLVPFVLDSPNTNQTDLIHCELRTQRPVMQVERLAGADVHTSSHMFEKIQRQMFIVDL